ncbi:MAG: rhodanese-like domain-containing protein [Burkholderiales bacterium]|nr:rhodanese-like domain-containing protein [Burkholderiales bacterium]
MIEKFVMDNWPLIAVAFVSGAMLIWPYVAGRRGGARLSTLEATQLINQKDAVVIDIRDQAEFARGHIANSRSFPAKVFEERRAELEKLKSLPVIVSCDSGQRAGPAAEKLRALGLQEVYVLGGGLNAWRDAGLPVAK